MDEGKGIYIGLGETDGTELYLLPRMANRHGLIAGATGTGKTVSMQVLAEGFSAIGVPTFMADVKGDVAGISQPGEPKEKLVERAKLIGLEPYEFRGCPTVFWDPFGENGHTTRATVSDMGPLLLSRLLGLNATQEGVLNMAFKIADENGLLLLDLKDLRSMLVFLAENSREFTVEYGNVSDASVGAIQRALLVLEQQGAEGFFGETALDIVDLMKIDANGRGYVNVLAAEKLMQSPRLYATFLLYLLTELFEELPEVGDVEKPKLVFFFDEAHLLFEDASGALVDKIEQVVRLVRSKGVGVFFVTQVPDDVPDEVLAQLGNRVQHALRAFTPRDQKAVKATAETMRQKPGLDIETAITELTVGEALISLLDAKGRPSVTERVYVLPPGSQIGPITPQQRQALLQNSLVAGVYEKEVDRESASEKLQARTETAAASAAQAPGGGKAGESASGGILGGLNDVLFGTTGPRGAKHDGLAQSMAKSAVRTMGSAVGREIIRGVLGGIFGNKR